MSEEKGTIGIYQRPDGTYDLGFTYPQNHLKVDTSLNTSVLIALTTEARAEEEDVEPGASRGGYWGDAYPVTPGRTLGSKLWVILRGKNTPESLELAKREATKTLQYLIDDGIARKIDVQFSSDGSTLIGGVEVYRGDDIEPKWVPFFNSSIQGADR